MPDVTQFLDAGGGARLALNHTSIKVQAVQDSGHSALFSLFKKNPNLYSVTTISICFSLDVLLGTIRPCCHDQCIRDQCIHIPRVGPHINVVQLDLSILTSCLSPEQDSRLSIHSPSSPSKVSSYSIPLLSVPFPIWPQNFFLCVFSL